MNDLLQVMQLIDKHSKVLPEGDYLELCKHLKKAYNKMTDPIYFFEYHIFSIPEIGPTSEALEYFSDHYFDRALCTDSDFIQGQISYLEKEHLSNQPLKRITKKVRMDVKRHYCFMYGLEEVDIGFSEADWNHLYKRYVEIENDFRKKYCESIMKKLEWLEESDERLDSV